MTLSYVLRMSNASRQVVTAKYAVTMVSPGCVSLSTSPLPLSYEDARALARDLIWVADASASDAEGVGPALAREARALFDRIAQVERIDPRAVDAVVQAIARHLRSWRPDVLAASAEVSLGRST